MWTKEEERGGCGWLASCAISYQITTIIEMINLADLEAAIRTALPVSHLEIEDQSSGCGESYAIVLVSEAFDGKNTLSRHRFGINQIPFHSTSRPSRITNHPLASSERSLESPDRTDACFFAGLIQMFKIPVEFSIIVLSDSENVHTQAV